ncbi:MAG: epimerase [Bacteroidia bacterium]|nr:epimerase [Bacteroidia bacterium]
MKIILTGTTGMVGEGVLHECLLSPLISEVLVVGRKTCGTTHAKLKEIIHADFFDLKTIAPKLSGYQACLFCLGVSSVGMNESDYTRMTHTLTLGFANALAQANPQLCFCYISGAATDSSEKGKSMWARVKGKTENDLIKLFPNSYMFRPGYMQPTKGLKNTLKYYKYIKWMYPFFKLVFPGFVSTLAELGQAMIKASSVGYSKKILEVKDIKKLANS